MIILFILLPLILIAIGISLSANAVESINKTSKDWKETTVQLQWAKHQKEWLRLHPNGTREQYAAWFYEQKRLGKF